MLPAAVDDVLHRPQRVDVEFQPVEQGDGIGFSVSLAVPLLFSFWLHVHGFGPMRRAALWLLRNAKHEDRETSLRVHDWTLWWTVWRDNSSWSSSTPRWREGNFCLPDFLLGRPAYSERVLKRAETVIPMAEASYPATVELRDDTWKRPRWFSKRLLRATVNIPKGVPFPGKGENSYDCGQDATFGLSCCASTVEGAVAAVVESVLRSRRRYGGSVDWRPAAVGSPEERAVV